MAGRRERARAGRRWLAVGASLLTVVFLSAAPAAADYGSNPPPPPHSQPNPPRPAPPIPSNPGGGVTGSTSGNVGGNSILPSDVAGIELSRTQGSTLPFTGADILGLLAIALLLLAIGYLARRASRLRAAAF